MANARSGQRHRVVRRRERALERRERDLGHWLEGKHPAFPSPPNKAEFVREKLLRVESDIKNLNRKLEGVTT